MSQGYVVTPVERASRRLGLFLLIVLGVMLTVLLFSVKTGAKEARADMERLERQIEAERKAIAVLEAELAVLTNPTRLRDLSQGRLGLVPIEVEATRPAVEVSQ